jgi:hypothetical protein
MECFRWLKFDFPETRLCTLERKPQPFPTVLQGALRAALIRGGGEKKRRERRQHRELLRQRQRLHAGASPFGKRAVANRRAPDRSAGDDDQDDRGTADIKRKSRPYQKRKDVPRVQQRRAGIQENGGRDDDGAGQQDRQVGGISGFPERRVLLKETQGKGRHDESADNMSTPPCLGKPHHLLCAQAALKSQTANANKNGDRCTHQGDDHQVGHVVDGLQARIDREIALCGIGRRQSGERIAERKEDLDP